MQRTSLYTFLERKCMSQRIHICVKKKTFLDPNIFREANKNSCWLQFLNVRKVSLITLSKALHFYCQILIFFWIIDQKLSQILWEKSLFGTFFSSFCVAKNYNDQGHNKLHLLFKLTGQLHISVWLACILIRLSFHYSKIKRIRECW